MVAMATSDLMNNDMSHEIEEKHKDLGLLLAH